MPHARPHFKRRYLLPRDMRWAEGQAESLSLSRHLAGGRQYDGRRRRRRDHGPPHGDTLSLRRHADEEARAATAGHMASLPSAPVPAAQLLASDYSRRDPVAVSLQEKTRSAASSSEAYRHDLETRQREGGGGGRILKEEVAWFRTSLKRLEHHRRITSAQLGLPKR